MEIGKDVDKLAIRKTINKQSILRRDEFIGLGS
jgi:hypothetical protein